MTDRRDELQRLTTLEPPDELDAIVLERAHGILQTFAKSRPPAQQSARECGHGGLLLLLRRALR